MASRVSQKVVEALYEGTPASRVSQEVAEVLYQPTNPPRVSQLVVEVLYVEGTSTNVDAELAAGTGSANQPTPSVLPGGGVASGTGSAPGASPSVFAHAQAAEGTGAAGNATVSTGGVVVEADAEVASAAGAALDATTHVYAHAGAASGTGSAGDAEADTAATVAGSFGLEAWITGGFGQHSRATDHFDAQPDNVITTLGVAGYPDGTLLSVALADMFDRVADLVGTHTFGLDAVIEAPTPTTEDDSFSLDAWIAYGGTFGLDATLQVKQASSFGLSAVIVGT